MKTKIFMMTMILMFASIENAQSQTSQPEKNNYLVLTKKIQQFKPALLTASELAKEDGDNFGEFQFIICGKTVKEIAGNQEFIKLLAQAKQQNVKVVVCGLSLNKFDIDFNDLPDGLEYTKNGIQYSFQLQKQGFYTLTI